MAIEQKPLFHPEVVRKLAAKFKMPELSSESKGKLAKWAELIDSGEADDLKESELLPDFITDFFCGMLGYSTVVDSPTDYTIRRENLVKVGGEYADAALGYFKSDSETFVAAIEGKSAIDPLDKPFKGRRLSAVEQGYRYATNFPCDWIIVTSMRETRLYHKGSDQHTFERFETVRLAKDPVRLRRFIFLLGADRVLPRDGVPHFATLLESSRKVGQNITNEFYELYKGIRTDVLAKLRISNPDIEATEILRCTQKLLDRILFTAFCEDRDLLPEESLKKAFEHADPYNPRPVWENFLGLFRSIDKGNEGLKIPAYNGGLFAHDEVLDHLTVPDEVCSYFKDLGSYEFRPASDLGDADEEADSSQFIDVEILGHIFEQSISDLEQLRQNIELADAPAGEKKTTTRRKKEGAFYTPAFITRYMVEQTLGSVLKDRFALLRDSHVKSASGTAKKTLSDPNVYDLSELNEPQRKALIQFWEAWQDDLKTVRILDPACGSGAFLIEAFDQLFDYYQVSNARLEELRGHRSLFDLDRQILQNNLYGVDLNPEAVQICQLSLWIKTAARGKELTSLDDNIKAGNSVVDDPAVHPGAFDWTAAFPEVFEQGGFDVVIGNPPYIRQEWIAPYKSFWEKRYKTYHGVADIFTYFFEQGIELLRTGGQLAYITSGSWVRGNYGGPLRKFLSEEAKMESMIDFGEFQPFEDAEMIRPTIAILSNNEPKGDMRLYKWLTSGRPPETLSNEIRSAPTVCNARFGETTWELESDAVLSLREKLSTGRVSLNNYVDGSIYRGILTGLTEAYVIDRETRNLLIEKDHKSEELIKPFAQGTHLRSWYQEIDTDFIIAIPSSANFEWPWSNSGNDAEQVFAETYPAIYQHLNQYRNRAIKRSDQGKFWWELRSCNYWDAFDEPKIVWPDISKLPRFSLDVGGLCMANTGYVIPKDDLFLLGILSSWATWFFISKTAQPLRLRGDRWQYRLIAQFMVHIPIPEATDEQREAIAELAETCSNLAKERYQAETAFQRRLTQAFLPEDSKGKLNQKATAWWTLSLNDLGAALKTSFKLPGNPMKSPHVADEWESYLHEKQVNHTSLTNQLNAAEADLNDRVYQLFDLTKDEITLLQKEVEH